MTALLKPPARPEGASNTWRLPTGERLRRELVQVFRSQRQKIIRYLRTGEKDAGAGDQGGDHRGGLPPGDMAGLLSKDQAPPPIPFRWPDWHDFGLGALAISERMTPLLTLLWDDAGRSFAPRVGLDPDSWSVVNPHTERMIEDAALAFCDSTNRTTSLALDEALDRVRQELHAGVVAQGKTIPELTKAVNAIFDGAETWRARRIAQTEASRAVHSAQEQAAIASGVVTGWKWLASADACPICIAIAARAPAVPLGRPFAVIGHDPNYAQIKFPPAHPHCACTVVEVLDIDDQPEWSATLEQPDPATDAEADDVYRGLMRDYEEILNPRKPAPKPAPATPAARKPPRPRAPKPARKPAPRDLAGESFEAMKRVFDALNPDWTRALTPGQAKAVREYTGYGYRDVNLLMRRGVFPLDADISRKDAQRIARDVKAALATASLPQDLVVYRGIRDAAAVFGVPPEEMVGKTLRDKGFLSTSLDPQSADAVAHTDNAAILRIVAPKGSRGASVSGATDHPNEVEILFAPGSRLRIVSVGRDAQGRYAIEATLVAGKATGLDVKADGPAPRGSKFGWEPGDVEVEG